MSRDLKQLLQDTAAEPTRPVDPRGIVEQARRRTWTTRALVSIVAIFAVVGAILGAQQVLDTSQAPEIANQPGQVQSPDGSIPSGWQTLHVGNATFAVPGEWSVQRIDGTDDPMPCLQQLATTEHRVYIADRQYMPSCPATFPREGDQQGQVTVYAYPAGQMSPDNEQSLTSGGERVEFSRASAWMGNGEAYRTYLFDDLDAVLLVTHRWDPQLADRILNTVQPGGAPNDQDANEMALSTFPTLPEEGIAVEVDGQVRFLGLDGTEHGYLPGTLRIRDAVATRALRSPTNLIALTTDEQGEVWLDPDTGTWQPADRSVPLQAEFHVVYNPDADPSQRFELRRGDTVLASWPEGVSWWLTPDHRVVSWESCEAAECDHRFLDTDSMDEPQDLPPGCRIGHVLGDFAVTQICEDGQQIVRAPPSPDAADRETFTVPRGTDGQPAQTMAVYRGGIVRVDHATCEISEPMRLNEQDGLVRLLGDDPRANPSAVPLGVTDDGQVVLHYNSAACDATDRNPGVYLYDPDTGERQPIYEGHLQTGEAQMWSHNKPSTAAG